jgi:hypothetical protein
MVLTAGLALAAIGTFALWPSRAARLTHENVERIHVGMNRAEVEAILGPPGDYTTGPLTDPLVMAVQQGHIEYQVADGWLTICAWATDKEAIWVSFDNSKVARDVVCCASGTKLNQTPLENLLWRMRRGFHK